MSDSSKIDKFLPESYLSVAGKNLPALRKALNAGLEDAQDAIQSIVDQLFLVTASGKYLLPGLIARFREQFPQVRINVIVSSRNSVIERILSGRAALGISSKRVDHRELEHQEFFTDEVVLVAPNGHPWVRYGMIYPDDLLDEPMILREEASGTREILMDGLRKHDISPDMLNVAMVIGNAEAILMAVEEGIGVAFVSRLAASRCLTAGRIVEIGVEGMPLHCNIHMARSRRFPRTRAQSEFWDFVSRIDVSSKIAEKL